MTDSDFRLFIHFRFGMVGNTQPGNFDHRQIVRAIADGDGLLDRDGIFLCQTRQRIGFVLRIHDVADDLSGEFAVHDLQLVCHHGGQTQLVTQVVGKEGEPAGGNRHFPAERLQLEYQLRKPRHQGQFIAHLTQNVSIGPLQGRHALSQAGGEIQLAAHRALGDFRHQLSAARQFSNLVNTLDLNGGGVHVHYQQAGRFQVRNFAEGSNVQPGVVRQTRGALRQGTRQANDLIIFHTPGRNDDHRCAQFGLILGEALLIQAASVQQPAATASVVIERHHLIAT